MRVTVDHLGRTVEIPALPRRIVSLCPSQTETLFSLGVGAYVVGATRYCVEPALSLGNVARVGGTKKLQWEKLHELSPDLVICEKEENPREMVEELERHYPVFVTDVRDIPSALRMIEDLGALVGATMEAAVLSARVRDALSRVLPLAKPKTVYLIWRKPTMVAGSDTFIDSMLELCGFENLARSLTGRYPEVTAQQLAELKPEIVLLSSEPYPFKHEHFDEIRAILPEAEIYLADGQAFSWYGSRLVHFPEYFQKYFNEAFSGLRR